MPKSVKIQKKILLQEMLHTRRNISSLERRISDQKILNLVTTLPVITRSPVICLHVSQPDEVDTKVLINKLLKRKKIVIIPRSNSDGTMSLHQIRSLSELSGGRFGILEPQDSQGSYPVSDVDVFIVPGVAFDRSGNRLGRGLGYYDKLLASVKVAKIGLAYDRQIVPTVPIEQHDIPVTHIITEKEVIEIT